MDHEDLFRADDFRFTYIPAERLTTDEEGNTTFSLTSQFWTMPSDPDDHFKEGLFVYTSQVKASHLLRHRMEIEIEEDQEALPPSLLPLPTRRHLIDALGHAMKRFRIPHVLVDYDLETGETVRYEIGEFVKKLVEAEVDSRLGKESADSP